MHRLSAVENIFTSFVCSFFSLLLLHSSFITLFTSLIFFLLLNRNAFSSSPKKFHYLCVVLHSTTWAFFFITTNFAEFGAENSQFPCNCWTCRTRGSQNRYFTTMPALEIASILRDDDWTCEQVDFFICWAKSINREMKSDGIAKKNDLLLISCTYFTWFQ